MNLAPKKAIYIGESTQNVMNLIDASNKQAADQIFWSIDVCSKWQLFFEESLFCVYDLLIMDFCCEKSSSKVDLKSIKNVFINKPIIALIKNIGPDLPGAMLSGLLIDAVNIEQDPVEILNIMSACYKRAVNDSSPIGESKNQSLAIRLGAGKTFKDLSKRIPNIVKSAIQCVHIRGESGVGKEIIAQQFKFVDESKPFIALNCASIPASLLEGALFGSVKGSFTGASKDQIGFLEAAHGGWIFLDEIGCLNPSGQACLLRAIENQEIIRVGENKPIKLNFRVISATNADLHRMVLEGTFRLDLYQRLSETEIMIPPLRERRDEISDIIEYLLSSLPGGPYRISHLAKNILTSYSWRDGNVRQLRNCLRAMTEYQVDGYLSPQSIPRFFLEDLEFAKNENVLISKPGIDSERDKHKINNKHDADSYMVQLRFPIKSKVNFDYMTVQLFAELAKLVGGSSGDYSKRHLAYVLGVSKSTVNRKIKEAINLGFTDIEEFFGI